MALTKATEKSISDNLSISGIATATNFKTGSSNLHSAGVEVAGVNILGADTPIGTGATIFDDGGATFTGIITAVSFSGSGSGLTGVASTDNIKTSTTANFTGGIQVGGATTLTGQTVVGSGVTLNATGVIATGIVTASSYRGDGSQLTGITGTTINNNADNRVITGSGTANTLNAESTLTWSGVLLDLFQNTTAETGLKIRNSEGSCLIRTNDDKTFVDTDQLIIRSELSSEYLRITSGGNLKLPDNAKIELGGAQTGAGDLEIFHESSSNDNVIDCATSRPLRIRMGGSNQFEFLSSGGFKMNDGRKIILGDSSDLKIEHNGSHSKILHNGTGDLIIHSQTGAMDLQHHHNTSIKTTSQGPEIGDTRHLRWASGNRYWTGEHDNKIQYHSNNLYNQYTTHWVARNASGTNTFTIDSSGNFSSDIRKKENITTVTDALTKVSQLRGVEFKWKEKYGNKEDMGLIAQEVETVLPKLIQDSPDPIGAAKENEDGTPMKMLNYNGLFSVMVEAIKDLKTKVETLETKVATLEGS